MFRSVARLSKNQATYSWLGWAPQAESACAKSMNRFFPGAVPGNVVLERAKHILLPMGLDPENTLYGQSICPDEINNETGDLANLMAEYWGEVFPMGGIGGAPFVGKTGFGAFSAHVPANGNIVVLFGPHCGISERGELGKYPRVGQDAESTACGAVLAAYDMCKRNHVIDDEDDMQQAWLVKQLSKKIDVIDAAEEPLAELMQQSYLAIKKKLHNIMHTNSLENGKKLVLIGGIQLNMPDPFHDHFQPLDFDVITKTEAGDMSASYLTGAFKN
jgi:hypothetical protein